MVLNAQLKKGGVKVISGPEIPFPDESSTTLLASYFNFPPSKYPVVIWELGTVTVQGSYKQITANMRAWANFKGYLAVADGLALTGTSPNLTGTYNLVVVGFLRGNKFFGDVNDGGGAAGAAAGAAKAGGPMAAGGPKMSAPKGAGAPSSSLGGN
jgi:hypothetical protein